MKQNRLKRLKHYKKLRAETFYHQSLTACTYIFVAENRQYQPLPAVSASYAVYCADNGMSAEGKEGAQTEWRFPAKVFTRNLGWILPRERNAFLANPAENY